MTPLEKFSEAEKNQIPQLVTLSSKHLNTSLTKIKGTKNKKKVEMCKNPTSIDDAISFTQNSYSSR